MKLLKTIGTVLAINVGFNNDLLLNVVEKMTVTKTSTAQNTSLLLILFAFILTGIFSSLVHIYYQNNNTHSDHAYLSPIIASILISLFFATSLIVLKKVLVNKENTVESDINQLVTDNTFFRMLSEQSSDMILICDGNCKILYVNPVTLELTGYDYTSILNKDATNFIHPNDHDLLKQDAKNAVKGGNVPAREIRLQLNSGNFFDAEVKIFSFHNNDNRKTFLGAVLRDISSRKKNEQLLKVQEEWEQTFNTMTEFVSVHDKDFNIVKVNSALCEFLGKSPGEIIGKPCYKVFHNTDEPYPDCPHSKASETGHSVSEIINDPNIGVPLQVTCSPFLDTKGEVQGSVHICRVIDQANITEKSESEIVPICASCKDVRNDADEWITTEHFFTTEYDVLFTHSICPGCQKKLYPEHIRS